MDSSSALEDVVSHPPVASDSMLNFVPKKLALHRRLLLFDAGIALKASQGCVNERQCFVDCAGYAITVAPKGDVESHPKQE